MSHKLQTNAMGTTLLILFINGLVPQLPKDIQTALHPRKADYKITLSKPQYLFS